MNGDVWVVVEHLRGEVTDISYSMLAAGRVLADGLGRRLCALLLGHNAKGLIATLGAANHVTYVDHPDLAEFNPDAYLRILPELVGQHYPRAVFFGQTTMGMDLAAGVGIELKLPVVSSCQTVSVENGVAGYVSLTCGGKILAEGTLPEPSCIITLMPGGYKPAAGRVEGSPDVAMVPAPARLGDSRTDLKRYVEPAEGDIDIAKEPVLVSVGRGIQQQENIGLAEELAAVLGGAVSASRPVVDQGWLPVTRLVGKSGKSVKPKVYLGMGISGAPEHAEAMRDAELIVAVNTDEKAPIYGFAHYGAAVDVLELMPRLTAKIKLAKNR